MKIIQHGRGLFVQNTDKYFTVMTRTTVCLACPYEVIEDKVLHCHDQDNCLLGLSL